jgi:hypothetical protein
MKDMHPQRGRGDSIEAIDAVRSIGNIGAHMEKDISVLSMSTLVRPKRS